MLSVGIQMICTNAVSCILPFGCAALLVRMSSVIPLVYVLLPALAVGSTVHQVLLCTDSYAEFESASVGSNISGNGLRSQLYEAFFAPNQHLPYSVIITYQLVLANGTRLNLSSDQDCNSELWMWVSSPVFLIGEGGYYANRYLLYTLNYFIDWTPPYVTITTTVAPCPARMRDFLSEMTASVGLHSTLTSILVVLNQSTPCTATEMHARFQSVPYNRQWLGMPPRVLH